MSARDNQLPLRQNTFQKIVLIFCMLAICFHVAIDSQGISLLFENQMHLSLTMDDSFDEHNHLQDHDYCLAHAGLDLKELRCLGVPIHLNTGCISVSPIILLPPPKAI
jgi:hypothetical protein